MDRKAKDACQIITCKIENFKYKKYDNMFLNQLYSRKTDHLPGTVAVGNQPHCRSFDLKLIDNMSWIDTYS